jgi:polyisoprenyl-phosphate glycosyltransferase
MARISIVVPVYFNAASLPALADRLGRLADRNRAHRFEFVFVDDGSGDDSFDVLRRLRKKDSRIAVVKLTRNFGSNTAILAGLAHSRGDCAGFIAADLQDPPETLGPMIDRWKKGSSVVLAVRRSRRGDPWLTRVFASGFNRLFKKVVFGQFFDEGVGFFLADRRVVDFLVRCNEKNMHLIGLLLWSGFDHATVAYDRVEREHGRSRWTFGKKFKYFIDAFTSFSYLPLRACLVLGLALAAASVLYAAVIVVMKLEGRFDVPGWSAMMVAVLFLSGTQLTMLGMIGEYLWRNFDATRQRPAYVVDTVLRAGSKPRKKRRTA